MGAQESESPEFDGTLRYADLLQFQWVVGLRRLLTGLGLLIVGVLVVLNVARLFVAPNLTISQVVLPQVVLVALTLATAAFGFLMQPLSWLVKPYNRSAVRVDDSGIHFRRRVKTETIHWVDVKRVVETPTHVFMILREGSMFRRAQACVLPKRQMGDAITRNVVRLASRVPSADC